jgi:hypothetical protein
MKPHIRKATTPGNGEWWVCLHSPNNWWRGGIGATPKEAYADWAWRNWGNQGYDNPHP